MKKIISVVLTIVMLLSLGVVTAYADALDDGFVVNTFEAQVVGGLTKVSINWDDVKGASYYEVNIDTNTDYYDIKETVNDNSYDWAPDYFITPDMPFVLTVYAFDEDGAVIAHSEVVTFYVGVVMCDYWGIYGDVDNDRMATVIDATLIQMNLAKKHSFDYFKSCQADTDSDGGISIMDATFIQLFCAEIYEENSRVGYEMWVGAVNYEIMFEPLG